MGLNPLEQFSEDPLAMSFANYHNWRISGERFLSWDSLQHYVNVTDRELAKGCRIHFRNKYTLSALKRPLTKFQKELGRLLIDEVELESQHVGMLYKIPFLFFEDLAREELQVNYGNSVEWPNTDYNKIVELDLTFVSSIYKSRHNGDREEFWYCDDDNHLFMMSMPTGDKLRLFWKSEMETAPRMRARVKIMPGWKSEWMKLEYSDLEIVERL